MRKNHLANGEFYHIFTKSIADFHIFNHKNEFSRMIQLLRYYQIETGLRFSDFIELKLVENAGFDIALKTFTKEKHHIIQIITYCLMPTHLHLILKQLVNNGISIYMSKVLNGYTRFFNTKYRRKGPLWESEFKNVLIYNDVQLLHLTRYLHLNPVTAYLVENPKNWIYSSYQEYLKYPLMCNFKEIINIEPAKYRKFVNDQISYQRELNKIKHLILD